METKTPDNEYCDDTVIGEQDSILTKELKERAHRLANLKRTRESLIDTCCDSTDEDMRRSLLDVVCNLRMLEKEIENEMA